MGGTSAIMQKPANLFKITMLQEYGLIILGEIKVIHAKGDFYNIFFILVPLFATKNPPSIITTPRSCCMYVQ